MKVFVSHSTADRVFVDAAIDSLVQHGHEVVDASKLTFGADLFSEISRLIRSSDVVLVVLNQHRPNLYFELGLAAGAGKAIIMASEKDASLPSDVASLPFMLLSGEVLKDAQAIAQRVSDLQIEDAPSDDDVATEDTHPVVRIDDAAIQRLSPVEFEQLVADALRERGLAVSPGIPGSDLGYDMVALSADGGLHVLVEVKRYSPQQRVSLEAVRSLAQALDATGYHLGLLITTARFTPAAIDFASRASIVLKTFDELLRDRTISEVLMPHAHDDVSATQPTETSA